MGFIFPVLSLWCSGAGIANRSTTLLSFGALLYLPWMVYCGHWCWVAEGLLLGISLVESERVQWVGFVTAVSLTLWHFYSLLQTI